MSHDQVTTSLTEAGLPPTAVKLETVLNHPATRTQYATFWLKEEDRVPTKHLQFAGEKMLIFDPVKPKAPSNKPVAVESSDRAAEVVEVAESKGDGVEPMNEAESKATTTEPKEEIAELALAVHTINPQDWSGGGILSSSAVVNDRPEPDTSTRLPITSVSLVEARLLLRTLVRRPRRRRGSCHQQSPASSTGWIPWTSSLIHSPRPPSRSLDLNYRTETLCSSFSRISRIQSK